MSPNGPSTMVPAADPDAGQASFPDRHFGRPGVLDRLVALGGVEVLRTDQRGTVEPFGPLQL